MNVTLPKVHKSFPTHPPVLHSALAGYLVGGHFVVLFVSQQTCQVGLEAHACGLWERKALETVLHTVLSSHL